MTIILFLIVLAVLIFVHELGHFLAAKKSGIRVDEFAIGFPPKIFGWTRGETKYVLNAIPFGGYVKIFGENPDPSDEALIRAGDSSTGDNKRSFAFAPKWKQILILVSGVGMNIIFAWLLISISFMFGSIIPIGDGTSKYSEYIKDKNVIVTSVIADSPAAKAGLRAGDKILSVAVTDQKNVLESQTETVGHIQSAIQESKGLPVNVKIDHEGQLDNKQIIPIKGINGDNYAIGISMETIGTVKLNPALSLLEGGKLTVTTFRDVTVGLYDFLFNAIKGKADFSQVSGPVGIVGLVGEAVNFGLAYFLGFVAFISLNLAVINLIPFPALDGGRVFFIMIEAIIRRPIKPAIANAVNTTGFFILIALMLVITYRDIMKFF
jgi:regulator of sigma E protease